jgi:hypothetical protein
MMHVGIFWIYRGQLILKAVPLQEGLDDGDFINGPEDHLSYWDTLRRTRPALRSVEYDAVPRGRVLYKKSEGQCYVYMDIVLHHEDVKKLLRHHFALPAETPFATDIHYTTTPADLARLFDDHPSTRRQTMKGRRRDHTRSDGTT